MRVHISSLLEDWSDQIFSAELSNGIDLSFGPELPERLDFHGLVAGRPTDEQLAASDQLEFLVIPWAGLPGETRERLLKFPELPVYNLHHNANSTAELALALLFAAAKRLVPNDQSLRRGDWRPRYNGPYGFELSGRSALIIGYGEIGSRVARMCHVLGMQVTALRRNLGSPQDDHGVRILPAEALLQALPEAQILVLCVPLTPETDRMIGKTELDLMPPGGILINVGRGELVDQWALYRALAQGELAGAGLDVWYQYPDTVEARIDTKPAAAPFWRLDNVVLSPHRAGMVEATPEMRTKALVKLLNRISRGDPIDNVVDVQEGY